MDLNIGDMKLGGDSSDSSPLGDAVRHAIDDAVKKIVDHLKKTPWEARIAELEKDGDKVGSIYVNAGSVMGIKEGDEFDFYKPGRDIVDPQTRVVIGRTKDRLSGHGKVQSVTDNLAIVVPTDGSEFTVGDVVRFAASK